MIKIRNAAPEDAPAIMHLIQELAEDSGDTSPISETYVIDYLDSPDSHLLLAEEAGGVIGLLSYSLRPDLYHAGRCCMVEELVVSSDKRSLGIGGVLLDALIEQAEAEGWVAIAVGVMPDNHRAKEFYRRHGLIDEAVLLERHLPG